jgi:hypothetical protein
MVDIPDKIGCDCILLIVECISASIITKFLVWTALDRLTTVLAKSLFSYHSKKVSLNLGKLV